MTLLRPAACKNVIAVGNLNSMKGYQVYLFKRMDYLESPDGTKYNVKSVDYHTQRVSINIVNATLKSNIDEKGGYKSVYLYDGGANDLEKKRKEAEEKEYLGIIHKEGTCNMLMPEGLPCFLASKDDFEKIKQLKNASLIYNSTDTEDVGISPQYSSKGLTIIGLTKPDLVAPGTTIVSARGRVNHNGEMFELATLSGTPMATPSISGLALLARQYFQDGYFPTLSPNSSDKMNITAALLKAILVNSAIPKNWKRSYEPDDTFGFGVPALDKTLGFVDGFGVTFEDTNISNGEHQMYTLKTEKEQNLTVTISYIDTYYQGFSLVYNVDLIIVDPDGNNYSGNHRNNFSSDMTTVTERIHIPKAKQGTYKIHVLCHPLKSNNVSDSVLMGIAVMGGFTTKKGALEKAEKAECITSKCDEKVFPICEDNKRGNFCQETIDELPNKNETSFKLTPKYTKWIHLRPGNDSELQFDSTGRKNWLLNLS